MFCSSPGPARFYFLDLRKDSSHKRFCMVLGRKSHSHRTASIAQPGTLAHSLYTSLQRFTTCPLAWPRQRFLLGTGHCWLMRVVHSQEPQLVIPQEYPLIESSWFSTLLVFIVVYPNLSYFACSSLLWCVSAVAFLSDCSSALYL